MVIHGDWMIWATASVGNLHRAPVAYGSTGYPTKSRDEVTLSGRRHWPLERLPSGRKNWLGMASYHRIYRIQW